MLEKRKDTFEKMVFGIVGKYCQELSTNLSGKSQPISCENSPEIIRTNQGKIIGK